MRLIDADALKESVSELKRSPWCTITLLEGILKNYDSSIRKEALEMVEAVCIDGSETVDPIKHGKWKEIDPKFELTVNPYYECSICKKIATVITVKNWKYCPNCGAKMDEELIE